MRLEAAVASAVLASPADPAALRAIADLAATADVLVGPRRCSAASTRSHFTQLELCLSPLQPNLTHGRVPDVLKLRSNVNECKPLAGIARSCMS